MLKENMKQYSAPFAAWELRLYLDTHPGDEKALQAYRKLCCECGEADPCSYSCAGTDACTDQGRGRPGCGKNVWRWIDGPWPWEPEANGVRGTDGCARCGTDLRRGGN